MAAINDNLQAVAARIRDAARAAGRDPSMVRLLAVTKTQPPSAVEAAYAAGQRSFGENYVQEALDKQAALAGRTPGIEWHLIGPLQSNKTRVVAQAFDWVETIDRQKVAQRLSDARALDVPPLNVLIQVNVSGEATKSGVSPAGAAALAREVARLPRLRLRGLMAIPEPTTDRKLQLERFHAVRELFDRLNAEGLALDTLSMGMSQDLESAVAEGSTLVRIGTAIFGERPKAKAAA
ncbi:MAG: YggS family pyridoxal phosphate-dependent enzyme [Proteobacteria bacterium]|nr:YggS family pyridoxal phosphate-dependent enzyme [Pseudomonadota bacterium]